MKHPTKNRLAILALIVAAVTGVMLTTTHYIVKERLEDLTDTLTLQVSEQEAVLSAIASVTARSGADPVTESIVIDCQVSERTEFETLLSRLDQGLPAAELVKLERLFGRCGSFFAQRKSVIVARFEREMEVYVSYVEQLNEISDTKTEEAKVQKWQELVTEEKVQSEQFSKLVALQGEIINTLLNGKSAASPEIKDILARVKQEQEVLAVANKKAGELRTALIPL